MLVQRRKLIFVDFTTNFTPVFVHNEGSAKVRSLRAPVDGAIT